MINLLRRYWITWFRSGPANFQGARCPDAGNTVLKFLKKYSANQVRKQILRLINDEFENKAKFCLLFNLS